MGGRGDWMSSREAQRTRYQHLKYQVRDFGWELIVEIRARNQKKRAILKRYEKLELLVKILIVTMARFPPVLLAMLFAICGASVKCQSKLIDHSSPDTLR